jgi:hypothetical protein
MQKCFKEFDIQDLICKKFDRFLAEMMKDMNPIHHQYSGEISFQGSSLAGVLVLS